MVNTLAKECLKPCDSVTYSAESIKTSLLSERSLIPTYQSLLFNVLFFPCSSIFVEFSGQVMPPFTKDYFKSSKLNGIEMQV